MRIELDTTKNERNIRERNLPFERAADFDFDTAEYLTDERHDYGETRSIAVGYLDWRLHILGFVGIENGIRVISFRKANLREANKHGKALTLNQ